MWLPNSVFELFQTNKTHLDNLYQELASVRAERDSLKLQLATANNHFDWARLKINALEVERAALIEKQYGIKVPVPEIVRQIAPSADQILNGAISFDDMGDDMAKRLGLPTYNS